MLHEITKIPKSVMRGERGDMVVICYYFVLFWELIRGPFELFNMECFGRKRCSCCLQLQMIKKNIVHRRRTHEWRKYYVCNRIFVNSYCANWE